MMVSTVYSLPQNNTDLSHFKKQLLDFLAEVTKIWNYRIN